MIYLYPARLERQGWYFTLHWNVKLRVRYKVINSEIKGTIVNQTLTFTINSRFLKWQLRLIKAVFAPLRGVVRMEFHTPHWSVK